MIAGSLAWSKRMPGIHHGTYLVVNAGDNRLMEVQLIGLGRAMKAMLTPLSFPEKWLANYETDQYPPKTLTIDIAPGGSAKRMIMAANHLLLLHSAYARRAGKARDRVGLAWVI